MNVLASMVWIELHKALRSRVPFFTALGFMLVPVASSLLLFIYKDPDFARKVGLISAKANLVGGSADWPFFFGFMGQAVAGGGTVLFSLVAIWLFGREFSDGTVKDLLAVPVPRGAIILAKTIVYALWSVALTVLMVVASLLVGTVVGLPAAPAAVFTHGGVTLVVSALLVIAVVLPVTFFASFGRGFLAPVGITMLLLATANLVAVLGWGAYYPWSIPILYAQAMSKGTGGLEPASLVIVLLTGAAGILATYLWWKYADQNK
jgi:ABC-2 type transport system permease protein